VPPGVFDGQAEAARTLVQVKRAALENGGRLRAVKPFEIDEVDTEREEVAVEAREFFHVRDRVGLRFERLVLRYEGGDVFLRLAGKDFPHALEAEFLDRPARLAGGPTFIRSQPDDKGGQSCSDNDGWSPSKGLPHRSARRRARRPRRD